MTILLRRTAQWATWLLAACTAIWLVGDVTQHRPIVWENIAALWLVGWPVLFVGFSITDWVDRSGSR